MVDLVGHIFLEDLLFNYCLYQFLNIRAMLLALGLKCVNHPLYLLYFTIIWQDFHYKVAADRTKPNGRVLGVDIIPAQPPKGVSTIQGNFLAPEVQKYILDFLRDPKRGRPRQEEFSAPNEGETAGFGISDQPRQPEDFSSSNQDSLQDEVHQSSGSKTVDVALSDMSAPWYQTAGFWKRSLSEPYNRMMNTSGMNFRDHAGSMVCIFQS